MPRTERGIHYATTGSGEALVFLHGVTLDGTMWSRQTSGLSGKYRCVTVDRRGHGRSEPIGDEMDEVADLLSVLDHTEVNRCHMVGLSLGGYDALALAGRHPGRVRSLTLVDPWLPIPEMTWSPPVRTVRNEGLAAGRRAWEANPLFEPARRDPGVWSQLATMMEANDLAIWTRRVKGPEPPVELCRSIQTPTQLIMGELDLAPFHAVARWLTETVPGAAGHGIVTIQEAGHMAPMEKPGAFNAALASFLAEVGE